MTHDQLWPGIAGEVVTRCARHVAAQHDAARGPDPRGAPGPLLTHGARRCGRSPNPPDHRSYRN